MALPLHSVYGVLNAKFARLTLNTSPAFNVHRPIKTDVGCTTFQLALWTTNCTTYLNKITQKSSLFRFEQYVRGGVEMGLFLSV